MAENLRGRVGQRREAQSQANGSTGDVVKREPTLNDKIARMQPEFDKAMPRGAEAVQLIRDAHTAVRSTPKLAECTHESILGGLMTLAQLGLRVGVLGHAWLLPLWNNRKGCNEAQLIIGYQGMVELAHRSGRIESLIARTVYEQDEFDVEYGLTDNLVHKPTLRGNRGSAVAYYAVAKFQGGGHAFFVMSQDEMEEHRDKFAMAKKRDGTIVGPWRDNFESMALKTTVRQLSKWLPKATDFASAIAADETVRVDTSPNPDAMLHGAQVIEGTYSLSDDQPPPAVDEGTGPTDEEVAAMNREANEEAASQGPPQP